MRTVLEQSLPLVRTAKDARERYEHGLANGQIIRSQWHSIADDGRWQACALGMIGREVSDPSKCPAEIMPRWLSQTVFLLFARQLENDALDWGLKFYQALERIDGKVSFSVVHDWHATTVCPMVIDAAIKSGLNSSPHIALQNLHVRAMAGEKISVDEWRKVLREAYIFSYSNICADADAHAYTYADNYTDANAYIYAYVDSYAYAYIDVSANTYANEHINIDPNAYANAWKKLADGIVDALNRVQVIAKREASKKHI